MTHYDIIRSEMNLLDEQADAPHVTKEEYEALAAFRYALRRFLHFSEEAAQELGVSPQQHQALLAAMGFPGRDRATIGELAEMLQIRHHSAVGLVNRLEAQGLVKRHTSGKDRRQVYVRVTQHGRDILGQLSAAHREELRRIGPQLKAILETLDRTSTGNLQPGNNPRGDI